jgi:uncharacterized protein (TIGR03085 family)
MTNWAQHERRQLSDLFLEVGPDAPTLCGTWSTRDLAAHLVVRERRPDAAPGLMIKPLQGYTDKVRRRMATTPWPELVELVRTGPPIWSPTHFGPIDRATNTVEFFVHHEDVRRAAEHWTPRHLEDDHDAALWTALTRMGRLLGRSSPVGLTLTDTGASRGSTRVKTGSPEVIISGSPGELVLFMFGRQHHARVGLVGDEAAATAVMNASFGA